MDITPDEVECLAAIAQSSPMQDTLLVAVSLDCLIAKGLVTEDFGWPQLTLLGWAELDMIGLGSDRSRWN